MALLLKQSLRAARPLKTGTDRASLQVGTRTAVITRRNGLSCSAFQRAIEYEPSSVPLEDNAAPRPLVVMFGWLLAKSRHLERYGNIYRHHGADVITVKLEVMEVVRPTLASKVAGKVIELMNNEENKHKPIVVHGFSVGGYLYAEVLNKLVTIEENASVRDRIRAHVFDSPVDLEGIPYGVSAAALNQKLLQTAVKSLLELYLFATHRFTMAIYKQRSDLFFKLPISVPALFLFSENDKVARAERIRTVVSMWRDEIGMPVTSMCWKDSKHVSHMYTYPDEYLEVLATFLHNLSIFPKRRNIEELKKLL